LKKIDRWIEEELMSKHTIDVYLNSGVGGMHGLRIRINRKFEQSFLCMR
jgi:hypothetical protein